MPQRLLKGIEDGAHITQETYREALIEREKFRALHDELARERRRFHHAVVARAWDRSAWTRAAQSSTRHPRSGRAGHQPAIVGGRSAPFGVQLLGRWQEDERLTAVARWLAEIHFGNLADAMLLARPTECS